MSKTTEIDIAAERVVKAAANLKAARQQMKEAEEALVDLICVDPGMSKTVKTDVHRIYACSKLRRSVDEKRLEGLRTQVPDEVIAKTFFSRPTINVYGMSYGEKSQFWPLLASVINLEPGIVFVKVDPAGSKKPILRGNRN